MLLLWLADQFYCNKWRFFSPHRYKLFGTTGIARGFRFYNQKSRTRNQAFQPAPYPAYHFTNDSPSALLLIIRVGFCLSSPISDIFYPFTCSLFFSIQDQTAPARIPGIPQAIQADPVPASVCNRLHLTVFFRSFISRQQEPVPLIKFKRRIRVI